MNLKTSSTRLLTILLAIQLASCTIASPTPAVIILTPTHLVPTVTPILSDTPTVMPTATETNTPEPTQPTVFLPPELTKTYLSGVKYEDGVDFQSRFTPMTQAQFTEMNAHLLTNPTHIQYSDSTPPVTIYLLNESPNGKRMGIQGEVGVNIFPQFLVNVDGNLYLSMMVVVNNGGVNTLLPVTSWMEMDPPGRLNDNKSYLNKFGTRSGKLVAEYFIDLEDGTTTIEQLFINGIISQDSASQPFPLRSVTDIY